ncbi:MAG: hypothetical protein A2622_12850 [Bdellovibrionales bacterium RIFCSPHIGHO2_01_FULL_40_29]|nr:MAG: hypothetical protein A2622_12850 [Bdellovibrionales bacterium RIFCSPHIGHO2_01_FULL_40_29]OFZ33480.1 MAG: hypothetical protein A3D17_14035 [Bdellovibrionales bacterium RIFCSPHIGHO2_02_FULL_40_15]
MSSWSMAAVRLVEWHVKNANAPLILPVRSTESPEQAADRYLRNLSQNSGLMELFQGTTPYFETVKFKELSTRPGASDQRVLMQANRPGDYTSGSERVDQFRFYFERLGQKNYLLLINPTLGLSIREEREVFDQVYEKFGIYAGLGGDDVDPMLMKQENFHSVNTNTERDLAEIKLIRHFIQRGQKEKDSFKKSFYIGVCRASQLASVALGYKLIQDIPFQVGGQVAHKDDWHAVKLLPTTHNILKGTGGTDLVVNSLHHQSVIYKPGGFLELAALSPDGIVEATEFKNGRGALFQFHPELMKNSLGFHILSKVIQAKERTGAGQCAHLF